ncbi:ubiquitin carboxyl-terminal hydrolase 7-like [Crotalus adamanteus]|uniref:Ubiquitin carboxyl-terminal hydrolase 7-like n=1 Tax=Crotalus adamanteus TaxID=8729 RepID=A0AAW1BMM2_CROAD
MASSALGQTPEDIWTHQDPSKMVAATEYASDTTLQSANFASRPLASNVTARRMLWLKHWQADTKAKWHLTTAPYQGNHLFGKSLNPYLVENKDKRKVMAHLTKQSNKRAIPYPRGYNHGQLGITDRSIRPVPRVPVQPPGSFHHLPHISGSNQTGAYIGGHLLEIQAIELFLRFCYRGQYFQYRALLFGLSLAPRVFTKILAVLAAHLRMVPVRVQCYLDILIQASCFRAAQSDLDLTSQVLQQHGFSVKFWKSQTVPSSRLLHLGAIIDTTNGMVYLSQERLDSIRDLARRVYKDRNVPLVSRSQLLGKMVSYTAIVLWARLHLRELQWRLPRGHLSRSPTASPLRHASLFGWGAHLETQFAQGHWSRTDLRHNINWLELRAIHLALHHFHHRIRGRHVLALTDVASKAHVNRQGGTRSRSLMSEARLLGSWAESNLASIRAEHISGEKNRQADFLSRSTIDPLEWGLYPDLFSEISQRFSQPALNLFPSSSNAQLSRYFSHYYFPGAEGTDALWTPWPEGLLYASPHPLIPVTIRKLLQEQVEMILMAPYWSQRPWFADLMNLSRSTPWKIPRIAGLAPATIRRQVTPLSTLLTCANSVPLAHHPRIRAFKGACNTGPPVVHKYPSWELPLVLRALTKPPFEPITTTLLQALSHKIAFLVIIMSARRISELAALSTRKDLCIFHWDRVVLRLDPTFVPKANSLFHRAQEVILPNFCPNPSHDLERQWHTLDVRRTLQCYIKRKAPFCQSEALFISFLPASLGQVSASTVGRWIRACIAEVYQSSSLPAPSHITAHSTHSAAISAAWATEVSIEICRAVTWSSPSPFVRHYRIDCFTSTDASFGWRVL